MPDVLLTPKQVAEILNIKLQTVYAAATDGRLPCVRLWKCKRKAVIRFRREDIDDLTLGRTKTVAATERRR